MAKPLIGDIIVSKKEPAKTGTEEKKEKAFFTSLAQKTGKAPEEIEEIKERIEKPKKKWKIKFPAGLKFLKFKFILKVVAFGIFVVAAVFLLNRFSSVSVEITPRQELIEVNAAFKAAVDSQKEEFPLEVMRLVRSESGTRRPTGLKEISRKASGQIVIYNTYSSESQSLVKTTRFETPEGKIYRIDKSIVVPGTKVSEGKIIAGEIEATVYADKPGEDYNIGLTDFTIPGFKDLVKYEKIYGRSKTEMKGGFVGQATVISENDIGELQNSLREQIKSYLLKIGVNPKPDEFLLYDNAKKIVFEEKKDMPKAGDESNLLELEEKAVLYGFLLRKSDVSRALAEKYFSSEIASQIELVNADKLEFELKNFTAESASFNLKGQARFIWKIDENKLKNDLIAERKKPDSIFQKYPMINKAKIIFKPSWWRYIPNDASRISVKRVF